MSVPSNLFSHVAAMTSQDASAQRFGNDRESRAKLKL